MRHAILLATAVAAMVLSAPASARQLNQSEKNAIMTAFRVQTKEGGTVRFKWPALANAPFYCGLVKSGSTAGYEPFQVFGIQGKRAKLDIVFSMNRASRDSLRSSCERYGYVFADAE